MVTFGKTISLFLIEGDPNSRWVCELSNWNGKAYKIPRIKVHGCFDRPDLAACGIYFLFGKNDIDEKTSCISVNRKMYIIVYCNTILQPVKTFGMNALFLSVKITG